MSDSSFTRITLGDTFNGTLQGTCGDSFFARELKDIGIDHIIKTIMGWRDLPCLSFDEMNPRIRYRFEFVDYYAKK